MIEPTNIGRDLERPNEADSMANKNMSVEVSTTPPITHRKHKEFYFTDETVVLLVEDTLFRVHKHFLRTHSRVFGDMFLLPPPLDRETEGRTDNDPIRLPDTKSEDFARLLSLFYPKDVKNGDLSTVEEWTSVLAVSSRWGFDLHRQLSKERLTQLASPFERILLSRQYDVKEWLVPALLDLSTRDESLTLAEGWKLGMEDVILISDIRQSIRGNGRVTITDRSIVNLIHAKLNSLS